MLSDDKHAVTSTNPTNICGLNKCLADSESVSRFTNEVVAFIVLNRTFEIASKISTSRGGT